MRGVIDKKRSVIKKRAKAPKYKLLGEARISDDWGLDYTIKLKARPRSAGGNMLCFASSGGRWYFFIPVSLWGDMVKESNKLVEGARAP